MPLISFSRARRVRGARRDLDIGDRAEQAFGVGVARALEQILGARLLDLSPGIHHHHPVGILGDHAHVVGDQDDRGAERLLQFAHQVEDLGLDRHVERGGRLVRDQQLGVARHRHRDHHALAHAARELVRIGVRAALRLGNMDAAQHLHCPVHRIAPRQSLVQRDRLADLAAHRQQRVERGHRLLEDHRDVVAADALHFAFAELQQIGAFKADCAADDPPRRVGDEAQDGQRGHALAAPGLPDDAQGLAAAHGIGDAVDRPHDAAGGEKMRLQICRSPERCAGLVRGSALPCSTDSCLIQEVTPEISS